MVAQMTQGKAEQLFPGLSNMKPSKSSLDRLPKDISVRWDQNPKPFEAMVRQPSMIPTEAPTVAVSLDGVLVPMDGEWTRAAQRRATAATAATATQGRPTKGPLVTARSGAGCCRSVIN